MSTCQIFWKRPFETGSSLTVACGKNGLRAVFLTTGPKLSRCWSGSGRVVERGQSVRRGRRSLISPWAFAVLRLMVCGTVPWKRGATLAT